MKAKQQTVLREMQEANRGHRRKCQRCGLLTELTVDHIIPRSFLNQVGLIYEMTDWKENFLLLCPSCNAFKGCRIDMANPKTLPLLKEVVNKICLQRGQDSILSLTVSPNVDPNKIKFSYSD